MKEMKAVRGARVCGVRDWTMRVHGEQWVEIEILTGGSDRG